MQFLYYKNKILQMVQGKLPTSVFIWHIIFLWVIVLSIALSTYWYYKVYETRALLETGTNTVTHKRVVDIKSLKEIVQRHRL